MLAEALTHRVKKRERKIAVRVSDELLARAQMIAAAGITETVRRGLELLANSEAYEAVRKLRGKVRFSIDLGDLREDHR